MDVQYIRQISLMAMMNKVVPTYHIYPKISFYLFALTLDTVYDMKIRLILLSQKCPFLMSNISDKNGQISTKICSFVEYIIVHVVWKFH